MEKTSEYLEITAAKDGGGSSDGRAPWSWTFPA